MSALEHIERTAVEPAAGPTDTAGDGYPPRPDFPPLIDDHARQEMFGRFEYVRAPQPQNPEAIQILGDWVAENIVTVEIPQLAGISTYSGSSNGRIRFHRKAADQLRALWKAWEATGLLGRVIFWGGSFVPRLIRGSVTGSLSAHAFGSAFDINVAENGLGSAPARIGERGCVRELVALANVYGFFWGGHFRGRPDGMHFEVAKLNQSTTGRKLVTS